MTEHSKIDVSLGDVPFILLEFNGADERQLEVRAGGGINSPEMIFMILDGVLQDMATSMKGDGDDEEAS